jgi:Beta-ketoacyl synthase, N-terminal domain
MSVAAYVDGIGVLGPGLSGWPETAAILSGRRPYTSAPTVLPTPSTLPAAERRRTGRVVKVALGVALEATAAAAADAMLLPSVFSSSGSDGHICHEICEALSLPAREVSPTRFSNSVHNAPAGYWSIATGAMTEANALCAFDASFAAGLLDAMTQVNVDRRAVLLVAYDTEYPPPLHAKRPIPDAFGIALVLSPRLTPQSLARLEVALTDEAFDTMREPQLEALRASIPAARGLPLLEMLALQGTGRTIIEYLDITRAGVRIEPCR